MCLRVARDPCDEEILRRIRSVVRDHALPCLRSKDWKKGVTPDHVGLVYAILLTMSATDIYREGVRVLIRGEAVSQMFHHQLGNGYKLMLALVVQWCHTHTHYTHTLKPYA